MPPGVMSKLVRELVCEINMATQGNSGQEDVGFTFTQLLRYLLNYLLVSLTELSEI